MASGDIKPKSISRAKKWSDEIENLYRFQQAGYRDEIEYKQVKQVDMCPGSGSLVWTGLAHYKNNLPFLGTDISSIIGSDHIHRD